MDCNGVRRDVAFISQWDRHVISVSKNIFRLWWSPTFRFASHNSGYEPRQTNARKHAITNQFGVHAAAAICAAFRR
jgi:hypothetical protein